MTASLETIGGNGNPILLPVIAFTSLPTAAAAGAGAMCYCTGTAHATVASQLIISDGTNWKFASDGTTTVTGA